MSEIGPNPKKAQILGEILIQVARNPPRLENREVSFPPQLMGMG